MRPILLLLMICGLSAAAIVAPQIGLLSYIWYSLMRPDVMAWSYNQYPYALILATLTIAGSTRYLGGIGIWFRNPIAFFLIVLQIPIALSAVLAVDPALCMTDLRLYESVILMALLIPLMMQTEQQLRWTVLVVAGSLGFIGFKFGTWGIYHGGVRFPSGHGGFLGDNNGLALAMAMVVPLCWYASSLVERRWQKAIFWIMTFGSMATVIQTYSRGNALALGAVCLLLAWRSKRKLLIFTGLLFVLIPVVLVVGSSYVDRLSTISAPTEEGSAASRLLQYRVALIVIKQNPLTGVGFGGENYIYEAAKYIPGNQHVVHNTYLQMAADSGVPALLLFVALLFGTIWWLGRSAKEMRRTHPALAVYPLALQTSLIAFAIGSLFYSRVKFEPFYIVLMCAAAWRTVQSRLPVAVAEPQEEPVSAGPEPRFGPPALTPAFRRHG